MTEQQEKAIADAKVRRKKLEKALRRLQELRLEEARRLNQNPLRPRSGKVPGSMATWPDHYFAGRKGKAPDLHKPNYAQCAIACGAGAMHISRVLRGKTAPSVPLLERLSKYYGLGMEELWEYLKSKKRGARKKD